jgi:hypothetical protein
MGPETEILVRPPFSLLVEVCDDMLMGDRNQTWEGVARSELLMDEAWWVSLSVESSLALMS